MSLYMSAVRGSIGKGVWSALFGCHAKKAQNPVELIEVEEFDLEAAAPAAPHDEANPGPEAVPDPVLQGEKVGVGLQPGGRLGWSRFPSLFRVAEGLAELFGVAHGEAAMNDPFEAEEDVFLPGEAGEGPGMAHRDLAGRQCLPNLRRELQDAEEVRDGASRFAHSPGDLLLREPELVPEESVAGGFLDRAEIGPLDVLGQRHGQDLDVVDVEHDGGNVFETSQARGADPPLPCDEMEAAVGLRADQHGLKNPVDPDGFREFLEILRLDGLAGLPGIAVNRVAGNPD